MPNQEHLTHLSGVIKIFFKCASPQSLQGKYLRTEEFKAVFLSKVLPSFLGKGGFQIIDVCLCSLYVQVLFLNLQSSTNAWMFDSIINQG